jgi:ubiquinone/menaquinone biosynthesis C-methylase UbiE
MSTPSEPATSFGHDTRALAETYERLSDSQFEGGKNLVRHLGPLEGARVLDVGCGTGRLARWIAELIGPTGIVVGVDPLPERVAIARAQARAIRFEVGRAEDLSAFSSESFDALCMSSMFHWVGDKATALREARRVLKPGGRLGITTMSRELSTAGTFYAIVSSVVRRAAYADRVRASDLATIAPGLTTTDLMTTVLDADLALAEVHITPNWWHRASGREVVDFLESSSFGNFLRVVPDDLRDTLRTDIAAAFEERRERDGIHVQAWTALLVASRPSRR